MTQISGGSYKCPTCGWTWSMEGFDEFDPLKNACGACLENPKVPDFQIGVPYVHTDHDIPSVQDHS
jgi:hypothetical protein